MPQRASAFLIVLAAGLLAVEGACADDSVEAVSLYRPLPRGGAAPEDDRPAFSLSATPAVERGTVASLTRSNASEPLAPTYDAPHTARKEMGVSYSSKGRMQAYVATREVSPPAQFAPDGSDPLGAVPASSRYAKTAESPAVSSLLGRLKTRGLRLNLYDGWGINAGARSREYTNPALSSRIGHITLSRWWGDLRTAYAMQIEKRGGWNVAPSQSFQLAYALAPRSSVGIAYTTGHEIAFFRGQGMLKTEVRSLALQGEHAVDRKWSVNFEAGYYNHGDLPSQRTVRVAFRFNL